MSKKQLIIVVVILIIVNIYFSFRFIDVMGGYGNLLSISNNYQKEIALLKENLSDMNQESEQLKNSLQNRGIIRVNPLSDELKKELLAIGVDSETALLDAIESNKEKFMDSLDLQNMNIVTTMLLNKQRFYIEFEERAANNEDIVTKKGYIIGVWNIKEEEIDYTLENTTFYKR